MFTNADLANEVEQLGVYAVWAPVVIEAFDNNGARTAYNVSRIWWDANLRRIVIVAGTHVTQRPVMGALSCERCGASYPDSHGQPCIRKETERADR